MVFIFSPSEVQGQLLLATLLALGKSRIWFYQCVLSFVKGVSWRVNLALLEEAGLTALDIEDASLHLQKTQQFPHAALPVRFTVSTTTMAVWSPWPNQSWANQGYQC